MELTKSPLMARRNVSDDKPTKLNSSLPMLKKRVLSDENVSQSDAKRFRENLTVSTVSTRPKVVADVAARRFLDSVRPKMTSSATVTGVPTKATSKRPPAAAVPSAAPKPVVSGTGPKKRPGWDLKGQVADMQEKVSTYKGKMQCLTESNRDLKEELELARNQLRASQAETRHAQQQISVKDLELRKSLAVQQDLKTELQDVKTELQNLTMERDNLFHICETQKEELNGLRATKLTLSNVLELKEGQMQALEINLSQANQELEQLRARIAVLQKETAKQAEELYFQEMQRRKLHNIIQELKGNIRVYCRVRPLIAAEKERHEQMEHILFSQQDNRSITLSKTEESHTGREKKEAVKYHFDFDRVFQPSGTQEEVFEELALLVQSALDGYHVCIFAYGQTGSGKTYTMEGPDAVTHETMGMIPRAVGHIFKRVEELKNKGWKYSFTASFIEIYNETIRDLLVNRPEKNVEYDIKRVSQNSEELYVTNLKYKAVTSEEEVHKLLQIARTNRSVAKTAINDRSSRSHSVFQLKIVGRHEDRDLNTTSVLSLVDLAGSERLDKSLSTGDRLREAQAINTSLSTLGLVITSISNKEPHIPFRNSKLTYLLQNSLGGNSKTLMFVNISPAEENFSESLNSLRFASKVNECVIGTAHANRR